jgi:hypothetical protein
MFFPRGLKHNIHQPFCRKTAAVYFFASVDWTFPWEVGLHTTGARSAGLRSLL